MTFLEFCDELEYDLSFENGIVISGQFDKIGNHLGDFEGQTLTISKWQPITIRDLVNKYVAEFGYDPTNLTEEWYGANS